MLVTGYLMLESFVGLQTQGIEFIGLVSRDKCPESSEEHGIPGSTGFYSIRSGCWL